MELRRLDIRRLPGIDRGFRLGFAPGVNLIQGPNGSGKSSVARAILGLLFAEGETEVRRDVAGVFAAGGREFFVERTGAARASWRATDGGPLPALPAARTAAAFQLGLLDVHKAAADSDDEALASEIRSRMAGGYDLPGLLDGEMFRLPARRLAFESEEQAARQAVDQVRRAYDAVAEDERGLPELDRRIRQGADAAERRQVLELAGRRAQAHRRALAAAANLSALPAVLQRLRGDESERRTRLATVLRDEAARLATATAAAEGARHDLAAVHLPRVPSAAALAEARLRLDAARDAEGLLHRGLDDLAAAERAEAERGRHLDPAWPPDRRAPRTPADLTAAETLVRRLAGLDAQAQAVASQLARIDIETGPDPVTLREAMSHLVAWLAVPDPGARAGRRWPGRLACGLLVATAGGWFTTGHGGLVAVAAAVIGVGLLAMVLLASSRPDDGDGRRRHAEDALRQTSVAPPAAWQRDVVTQRLRDVAAALASALEAAARQEQHRQLLAEQARLHDERTRAEAQSHELAVRCGLDPAATALDTTELLRRVAEYHDALVRAEEARGKAQAASARQRDQLDLLGAMLAPYGVEPAADVAAAAARLADLERRAESHRDATARLTGHLDVIADAASRLTAAQAEWDDLFRSLELPVGAVADLERLLALAPRYLQAAKERDAAALAVHDAEMATADSPVAADVAAAALLPDDQRAAELADLDAAIAAAADAREQKGRVLGQADAARHGTRLQEALAQLDGARARWQRERERAQDNALARVLLTAVADEHQTRSLPPVLARATALFARFTAGRYDLRVERTKAADSFVALDTGTGRPLALHELSDGTRAQLLLAARLAFSEDAERGEPMPLLLDDTLTATDPQRFAAISGALLDLVSTQRRQVLVFTANPAVVAAWQAALAAAGHLAATVTDLAVVRSEAGMAPLAALAAPPRAVVPAPDGADPAHYACALGVPPLDVQAPASAAHLFYLLADDLAALHHALGEGATTWGAAVSLAAALGRPGAGMTAAQWGHLERRAAALDAFLTARRIGRGRIVDREVLQGCARVADSAKAADIEALLSRVGGRADLLLEALHAKQVLNVRSALIEELDAYLRAGGYLDDRPALAPDELRAHVVAAVRSAVAAGEMTLPELDALVHAWTTATDVSRQA